MRAAGGRSAPLPAPPGPGGHDTACSCGTRTSRAARTRTDGGPAAGKAGQGRARRGRGARGLEPGDPLRTPGPAAPTSLLRAAHGPTPQAPTDSGAAPPRPAEFKQPRALIGRAAPGGAGLPPGVVRLTRPPPSLLWARTGRLSWKREGAGPQSHTAARVMWSRPSPLPGAGPAWLSRDARPAAWPPLPPAPAVRAFSASRDPAPGRGGCASLAGPGAGGWPGKVSEGCRGRLAA